MGKIDPDICRMAREALGWSPAKLASAAGLTERTINDFEGRLRAPRAGTLIALRRAFREAGLAAPPLEDAA